MECVKLVISATIKLVCSHSRGFIVRTFQGLWSRVEVLMECTELGTPPMPRRCAAAGPALHRKPWGQAQNLNLKTQSFHGSLPACAVRGDSPGTTAGW